MATGRRSGRKRKCGSRSASARASRACARSRTAAAVMSHAAASSGEPWVIIRASGSAWETRGSAVRPSRRALTGAPQDEVGYRCHSQFFLILRRPRKRPSRRTPGGLAAVTLLIELAAARHRDLLGAGDARREIAGRLLRIDLDPRLGRDQRLGDLDALDDIDAALDDRLELDAAHRDEAVDAGDAEPVEDVRHQLLKAHVLDAGDAFGALEICGR